MTKLVNSAGIILLGISSLSREIERDIRRWRRVAQRANNLALYLPTPKQAPANHFRPLKQPSPPARHNALSIHGHQPSLMQAKTRLINRLSLTHTHLLRIATLLLLLLIHATISLSLERPHSYYNTSL